MIPVNELRYGNLVHRAIGWRTEDEKTEAVIFSDRLEEVDSINIVSIGIHDFPECREMMDVPPSDLCPVDIAPELLLMFGFEDISDGHGDDTFTVYRIDDSGIHICQAGADEESAGVKKGHWYVGDYLEMESMHQLQNYVFSNFKFELEKQK